MSERKYFFLGQKKIGAMYCVRERLFSIFFFFLGKQPIENKSYFYKSFPLTKNIFLLANLFFILPNTGNVKNYLYRRFSNKTNKALNTLAKI